jgi:hypothetical protein
MVAADERAAGQKECEFDSVVAVPRVAFDQNAEVLCWERLDEKGQGVETRPHLVIFCFRRATVVGVEMD